MLVTAIMLRCFSSLWTFSLVSAAPMWNNGGSNRYWNPQQAGSSQPPNAAQPWQAGSSYVPANQYWDAHGQPLPMTANDYPAHPSTPQFIEQPERPLDEEDFAILSELERGFATPQSATSNYFPAPSAPHGSYAGFRAPAQSFDPQWQYNGNTNHLASFQQQFQPATTDDDHTRQESSSHGRQTELNAAVAAGKRPRQSKSTKGKGGALREKQDWPPPSSLDKLTRYDPLATEKFGAGMTFKEDQKVQKELNDRYFGGKMKWVPLNQIPISSHAIWIKRTPLHQTSFLLPASQNRRTGAPMEVFMTDHLRDGGKPHSSTKGSPLEGNPHYIVWNVPEDRQGFQQKIEYLGTGIIRSEHNEDVDKAIHKILAGMERASQGPK
ncbi:hypothetical protein sr13367 [Sporisorium reilianum SRZ2]|uniref:Effector family protein Eff1 n=1 Tax=Sporisorium reilianum (strain SRZ2) TaxID=999809 RepID=E6ZZK8_SPORE|nr:hypothetical protein sr13367 [Sporisorium reilianum SRZ2]